MLKREELEGLTWKEDEYQIRDEENCTVAVVFEEDERIAVLLAATPSLALACLEMMRLLRVGIPRVTVYHQEDIPAADELWERWKAARETIASALVLAGVEVPE